MSEQNAAASEAADRINQLSNAVERRKAADADVGKALRDVALERAKSAENLADLNRILQDFSEHAFRW